MAWKRVVPWFSSNQTGKKKTHGKIENRIGEEKKLKKTS
jgi:hypothetical protein